MAICISLMFARLGGVVGSNVASLLLKSHCQMLLGLSGSLLIGKQFKKNKTISISCKTDNLILMVRVFFCKENSLLKKKRTSYRSKHIQISINHSQS